MDIIIDKKHKIYFSEENHRYYQYTKYGERDIVSVTQILDGTGQIKGKRFFKVKHRTRGTYVHRACYLDDCNRLIEDSVDKSIMPYVTAYRKWKSEWSVEIIDHELGVYSNEYDYAGTIDIIAKIKKGIIPIIDIKSGQPAASHFLQLAGYAIAYNYKKWLKNEIRCLYLRPDGSYKFDPISVLKTAGYKFLELRKQYHNKKYTLFEE
jgi:Holliday junction resolvase-like predicted endonuclease